jgi:ACS family hexuronate transporter-like MFS transporter
MTHPPPTRLGRYRWLVCALLFVATTIAYVDRQILAQLKPVLDRELGWTHEQFGDVIALFWVAYAGSVLAFGALVDRVGARIGYAVSIALWSLAAMAHAFVGGLGGLAAARVALGLGEGGNFPSAIKAVATWFPRRERALATSLFNAGSNVGAIVAPPFTAWVVSAWGWRAAFVAVGIAGLLWLGAWLSLYDRPERIARLSPGELAHIHGDQADDRGPPIGWLRLLRHRQTWSFIVAKLLTDPVWWFFLIWLPDFFKATRGLDLKQSAASMAVVYSIVTALGVLGGWLPGHLLRRGATVARARKLSMLVFALCVLPILGVGRASDTGALVLIGLAMAAHQAWSANLFTTVSDMFPANAIGSVIGLGGMAGSVGGILFPVVAGRLLDRSAAAGDVAAGYGVLFTVCAFAYLVAFALHHALVPRLSPLAPRAPAVDGRRGAGARSGA